MLGFRTNYATLERRIEHFFSVICHDAYMITRMILPGFRVGYHASAVISRAHVHWKFSQSDCVSRRVGWQDSGRCVWTCYNCRRSLLQVIQKPTPLQLSAQSPCFLCVPWVNGLLDHGLTVKNLAKIVDIQ